MKYGVLCAKNAKNIGDDIQTYASLKFLSSVDYYVEREDISNFKSNNNEPVAVIMNAWWMWKKWNWPPSRCIIPKLISMHFSSWTTENWGCPIKYEMLDGIGGEYLKSYEPVGCRDMNTLKELRKRKIKSYFSGCLTLTLPKQKKIKPKKEYICAVDIDEKCINKIKSMINDSMELKIINHDRITDKERNDWDKRMKNVEKLLTTYQNAKCVITSRLHAALPCLAMEVPVLLIRDNDFDRFEPYLDLLYFMSTNDFLDGKYDVLNPLENKKDYLKVREKLIKEVNKFIEDTKTMSDNLDDIVKTKYTIDEVKKWQYDLMKSTLDKWFYKSREMLAEYNKTITYLRGIEKQLDDIKNSTSWKLTKPIRALKIKTESFLKKEK